MRYILYIIIIFTFGFIPTSASAETIIENNISASSHTGNNSQDSKNGSQETHVFIETKINGETKEYIDKNIKGDEVFNYKNIVNDTANNAVIETNVSNNNHAEIFDEKKYDEKLYIEDVIIDKENEGKPENEDAVENVEKKEKRTFIDFISDLFAYVFKIF